MPSRPSTPAVSEAAERLAVRYFNRSVWSPIKGDGNEPVQGWDDRSWFDRAANDLRETYRSRAREDLTAALRLDDPETVERVARVLYREQVAFWVEQGFVDGGVPFEHTPQRTQDGMRTQARAAIRALLTPTDEQEDCT